MLSHIPGFLSLPPLVDAEDDQDTLLFRLHRPIEQIAKLLDGKINNLCLDDLQSLHSHSSYLALKVLDIEDGDDEKYRVLPNAEGLGDNRGQILDQIDMDIRNMRGWLLGKPADTMVEDIRDLRRHALEALDAAKAKVAALPLGAGDVPDKERQRHDPYKVPYEVPPWMRRGLDWPTLLNDDDKREFYEGIPMPGTDEWFALTEMERQHAARKRRRGLEEYRRSQKQDEVRAGLPLKGQKPFPALKERSGAEKLKTILKIVPESLEQWHPAPSATVTKILEQSRSRTTSPKLGTFVKPEPDDTNASNIFARMAPALPSITDLCSSSESESEIMVKSESQEDDVSTILTKLTPAPASMFDRPSNIECEKQHIAPFEGRKPRKVRKDKQCHTQ